MKAKSPRDQLKREFRRLFRAMDFVAEQMNKARGKQAEHFCDHWSREAGIKPGRDAPRQISGAASGARQFQLRTVPNFSLKMGGKMYKGPQMSVMDLGQLQQGLGMEFAVLLGTDHLAQSEFIAIDFPRRKFHFGPPR